MSARNSGDPGSIPGLGRYPGEGNSKPTPGLLPGESHGRRSLVGYTPWGRKEWDRTERLHFHFAFTLQDKEVWAGGINGGEGTGRGRFVCIDFPPS